MVVLRNDGDRINLLGLAITKTSRGFEVRNSTELVESLLNLYGLENSKPTAHCSQTLYRDGARNSHSSGRSRLEPHMTVQKGMIELVGRSDSDWARVCNAPKCYGISLQCTRSDQVQPEPEANSHQFQFLRSRAGSRRTLPRTSLQRYSSSRNGFRFGTSHSPGKGTSVYRLDAWKRK